MKLEGTVHKRNFGSEDWYFVPKLPNYQGSEILIPCDEFIKDYGIKTKNLGDYFEGKLVVAEYCLETRELFIDNHKEFVRVNYPKFIKKIEVEIEKLLTSRIGQVLSKGVKNEIKKDLVSTIKKYL